MAGVTREEQIGSIDDLLRDIFGKYLRPPAPLAGDMNVTLGQMDCLREIARLGTPTMSQVAEALGLHPSTVTVLVDGLVAHGLVKRVADPRDRRIVRVSETAKGRKNHERHMAQMRARIMDMLSGLGDADLAQLHDSLDILREAARRYAASKERPRGPADKPGRAGTAP